MYRSLISIFTSVTPKIYLEDNAHGLKKPLVIVFVTVAYAHHIFDATELVLGIFLMVIILCIAFQRKHVFLWYQSFSVNKTSILLCLVVKPGGTLHDNNCFAFSVVFLMIVKRESFVNKAVLQGKK